MSPASLVIFEPLDNDQRQINVRSQITTEDEDKSDHR